jgi:uncharacterized protein
MLWAACAIDYQNRQMTVASLLRRLPIWVEFLIVAAVCWGWFAFRSIRIAAGDAHLEPFNNAHAVRLLSLELALGTAAFVFLLARGWSRRDFPVQITWTASGAGFLLLLLGFLVNGAAVDIGRLLGGSVEQLKEISQLTSVSFPAAAAVSIVNGSFEELFLLGYIFKALERHSVLFIVGISACLRMIAHVYQGPVGGLSVLCMGIFFGLVYARYRQLWPLMFAHIIADLLALAR